MSSWITNPGEDGTILVRYEDDSWILDEPVVDDEVVCLLRDTAGIVPSDSPSRIEGAVSNYLIGRDGKPDYLVFSPSGYESADTDTSRETASSRGASESESTSERSFPTRALSDLSGSGEYVTVEAVVNDISWVLKDSERGPDIKGTLTTEDRSEKVVFIVNQGVNHPYLEEGQKFEFRGVKDYHYRKKDQIQVKITTRTDFVEKEVVWPSTNDSSSSSQTGTASGGQFNRNSNSPSIENLHEIASKKIGSREFTVGGSDDSIVGKAKKRARSQDRDPAIDPRFQGGDEEED